jgi:hypothetical protein
VSPGSYERKSQGHHTLFASITAIWGIKLIDPKKKKVAVTDFELVGLASTRIALVEGKPDQPGKTLAVWKMEIGDAASPGCHFHVQVDGDGGAYYPSTLCVPRLPGILASPMAAAEFVLGELFQDEWPEHSARTLVGADRWEGIQKKRLRKLLNWSLCEVSRAGRSPWMLLKGAKPSPGIFVADLAFTPRSS